MPTLVTTRPDWETRDPLACDVLGERLARTGYVVWRPALRCWSVFQPGEDGAYHRVNIDPTKSPRDPVWVWLKCDCNRSPDYCEPCIHKAAVRHEVEKPSQYRLYHEGF